MKNIQVIDGALNSTFPIYEISTDVFDIMFPDNADVVFLDEVEDRFDVLGIDDNIWNQVYRHQVDKKTVVGIHGTLHLTGSPVSKVYFPTYRETEVINDPPLNISGHIE